MERLTRDACRGFPVLVVLFAALGTPPPPANADVIFATSLEGAQIVRVDTATNAVTPIFSGVQADSLMFDTSGRIIYTAINQGQVRRFDPNTNSDVLLAGGLNMPADMILEPGGNTMLVSEFNGGKIDRINLTTLGLSLLGTYGGTPQGLAYDSQGRLFANLGNRNGGPTGTFIAQLDPVTGAVLSQTTGLDSLDGLTFDSFTGKLFASSLNGNHLYQVDPNNLASVSSVASGIPNPDGLTSNGMGDIFVAARGDFHIYQYHISSSSVIQRTFVNGLDDLAPATGLGAPVTVPEPASLLLAGLGALGLAVGRYRKVFRRCA
jgi:streptogramin lyase